jgi:hypothetical protein
LVLAKNLGNAKISKKAEFVWNRLIQFLKDLEMNGSVNMAISSPANVSSTEKIGGFTLISGLKTKGISFLNFTFLK